MSKMKRSLFRIIVYLVILIVIWFITHTIFIIIDGVSDEIDYVDVAIVLGNKVELDGSPSKRLKARLDKCIELYESGYFNLIIVSGGIGKEGFNEAKIMKLYLVDKGIPEDKIIEDDNGYNSFMTAQNTKNIMSDLELKSVMIITQYFHVSRTKLAFDKLGLGEVESAHAEIIEFRDVYSILREFPAYYKYLIK